MSQSCRNWEGYWSCSVQQTKKRSRPQDNPPLPNERMVENDGDVFGCLLLFQTKKVFRQLLLLEASTGSTWLYQRGVRKEAGRRRLNHERSIPCQILVVLATTSPSYTPPSFLICSTLFIFLLSCSIPIFIRTGARLALLPLFFDPSCFYLFCSRQCIANQLIFFFFLFLIFRLSFPFSRILPFGQYFPSALFVNLIHTHSADLFPPHHIELGLRTECNS